MADKTAQIEKLKLKGYDLFIAIGTAQENSNRLQQEFAANREQIKELEK